MRIEEVEYGAGTKVKVDYIPIPCQHCENAPCIQPNNQGAVYRRPDGIVLIDPAKAKGRKEIVDLCPYGAIYWNEELKLAQKCTLCAHMIDKGEKTTRCAESCPTQALLFGDLDDPKSPISIMLAEKAGKVESYKPEYGAKPAMKYVALPKPFIAGEVLLADKPGETAIGAKVTLQAKEIVRFSPSRRIFSEISNSRACPRMPNIFFAPSMRAISQRKLRYEPMRAATWANWC